MLPDVIVEFVLLPQSLLMGNVSLFGMADADTVVRKKMKFKVMNISIMQSGT